LLFLVFTTAKTVTLKIEFVINWQIRDAKNTMNKKEQEFAITTKKLHLNKGRLLRHYFDVYLMALITVFLVFYKLEVFVSIIRDHNSPIFLFLLFFPVLTILIYYNKTKELRLTELHTVYAKQENYTVVKQTLKTLGWRIKIDNKGFIEAYTNNFGLWTWSDQMFCVFITDNKILYTSLVNVDTFATQAITWGQNSRNKRKFKEYFELESVG
jgi:hypothetical protein